MKVKIINTEHTRNRHLIGTIIEVEEVEGSVYYSAYYRRLDGSGMTILKKYTVPVNIIHLGGE